MKSATVNRRQFLASSLIVLSAPALLTACSRARQAQEQGQDFSILGGEEARQLEAIAARIIPSDDGPGAREAGVIYFMDTVLGDQRDAELATLRAGLADLQAEVVAAHGSGDFTQLTPDQQDALLRGIERSEFFATVRYLTVAGMFSLPSWGGNRDYVGYELIGFEQQFAWAPPFGYYDAQYRQGGQ